MQTVYANVKPGDLIISRSMREKELIISIRKRKPGGWYRIAHYTVTALLDSNQLVSYNVQPVWYVIILGETETR